MIEERGAEVGMCPLRAFFITKRNEKKMKNADFKMINNRLSVRLGFLLENHVLSIKNYFILIHRKQAERAQRGGGFERVAYVYFETLPERFKKDIRNIVLDPYLQEKYYRELGKGNAVENAKNWINKINAELEKDPKKFAFIVRADEELPTIFYDNEPTD